LANVVLTPRRTNFRPAKAALEGAYLAIAKSLIAIFRSFWCVRVTPSAMIS
jgi:hypothetical protein